MERISDSPEFKGTAAQRAFLKYVVEKTLAGQADEIKGYTVATEVFGRREDFDQANDPIVSIQANKLRRALERYYLVAGQNDPIRVDIPKGTYVPVFHKPSHTHNDQSIQKSHDGEPSRSPVWPTILVRPFENLTGDEKLDYIGIGIATEIVLEITRYQEIRVLQQGHDERQRRASDIGARFVLCGSIRTDGTDLKVIVNLVDGATGMHIWGDSYRTDFDPAGIIAFQERIASTIVCIISSEDGVISKTLSPESKRVPPTELTTYQAMLRFYRFLNDYSPETFLSTFRTLRQACASEPECGLVWSMLARLYAINDTLELYPRETPLKEACAFAEKGVQLEPANQRIRIIMSFIRLLSGDVGSGLAEAERALTLNPNSLIMLENVGYLMTLCGDWEKGPALIRKAIRLNPYYNVIVHYPLWVDCIRRKDYEQAYRETLSFRTPLLFWDPLMKASVLGLQERFGKSRQPVEDLLKLKPDFRNSGRRLIRYYIKFDEIVDRLILGLSRVGIDLA